MAPIPPGNQSSAPTFSLATLRTVLAELVQEHPDREARLIKAANIVAVRTIERSLGGAWWVQSETDPTQEYAVVAGGCTCPDFRRRGGPCKHQLAVELLQRCERRDAEAGDPTLAPIPFVLTAAAVTALDAAAACPECGTGRPLRGGACFDCRSRLLFGDVDSYSRGPLRVIRSTRASDGPPEPPAA